jgi:hypothetical protein
MKQAAPQKQRQTGRQAPRRAGPAPQRKAAMGRPYGLNHVAIGPVEGGLEAQADHAAGRALRGERGIGRGLGTAPAASAAVPSRGEPLPAGQRAWLEPAFGADLRAVRLHHDASAATAARAEHAHAFTAGRDIYFNEGRYDPHAEAGRHLLAHEVAHVLHQTGRTDAAQRLHAHDTAGPGEVQRARKPMPQDPQDMRAQREKPPVEPTARKRPRP